MNEEEMDEGIESAEGSPEETTPEPAVEAEVAAEPAGDPDEGSEAEIAEADDPAADPSPDEGLYPKEEPTPRPELSVEGEPGTRQRWIELATSPDHKDIGRILVGAAIGSLFLAGVLLVLLRLQLAVPENGFLSPVTFDRLLSLYGTTGIFFFALPLFFGLFYYLVPLMIGSRGTALPRLGQLGMWLFLLGGVLLYSTILYTPPEAGINPLPPLSEVAFTSNNGVDAWIASVGLATIGFLLITIDLLVTIRHLRAPGMAWRRTPVLVWAAATVGWLFAVIGPIFVAAATMLMIDRRLGGGFFTGGAGGAPLLWQHLSYIFFAGVYSLVAISALGIATEVIQTFTGRRSPDRKAIVISLVAIAILGTLAWSQNMYTAPIPDGLRYFAMAMAVALIVPFGVVYFSLIRTVSRADFNMRAPLRYAMAALSFGSVGLLVELSQSTIAVGTQLQQTYDAWAATHFALIGFALFGGLAGLSYWYPKMTGRMLNEDRARKSFWLIVVGALIAIVPLFAAGVEGQVTDAFRFASGEGVSAWNLIASIGTLVLFLGLVLTIGNLIRSRIEEPVAPPDPWLGETLEWLALSPPPAHNFDELPDVRSEAPMTDLRDVLTRIDRESESESRETEPVA